MWPCCLHHVLTLPRPSNITVHRSCEPCCLHHVLMLPRPSNITVHMSFEPCCLHHVLMLPRPSTVMQFPTSHFILHLQAQTGTYEPPILSYSYFWLSISSLCVLVFSLVLRPHTQSVPSPTLIYLHMQNHAVTNLLCYILMHNHAVIGGSRPGQARALPG